MPPFDMLVSIPVVVSMLSFLSFSFTSEAVPDYRYHICSNTTTFSPNSTYQSNLNQLFSLLTSNASRAEIGFYNTTAGQYPGDVVYGSFLCRGDLTMDVCRDCVAYVVKEVVQVCPIEKVVVIWYDQCMLRYSNVSFFGLMDESPSALLWNVQNITEQERFNDLLANTMNGLVTAAANAPSGTKKFATKEANFSGFENLYSLVQCTPDLSSSDCNKCLRVVVAGLPNCCAGKRGGNIMNPSCNVRYEVYPFYNVTAVALPPSLALPPPPPPLVLGTPSKGMFRYSLLRG